MKGALYRRDLPAGVVPSATVTSRPPMREVGRGPGHFVPDSERSACEAVLSMINCAKFGDRGRVRAGTEVFGAIDRGLSLSATWECEAAEAK